MSDSFSVDLSQLTHFTEEVRTVPADLDREMLKAANVVGLAGESIAKQGTPVWQGALRNSIQATQAVSIASGVSVSVATNMTYAATMEYGRAPGSRMPPEGALLAWMAARGIDPKLEFVVRAAIAKHGLPGHFYMKAAFDKLAGGIVQSAFDAAIERALASAFGGAA